MASGALETMLEDKMYIYMNTRVPAHKQIYTQKLSSIIHKILIIVTRTLRQDMFVGAIVV